MSPILLVLGIVNALAVAVLSFRIRNKYVHSLTSVDEKSAGIIYFYRATIGRIFARPVAIDAAECALHYILLHTLWPLLGLGLFLKTDGNFLVIILSLIWTMQLIQRVYPGESSDESEAGQG